MFIELNNKNLINIKDFDTIEITSVILPKRYRLVLNKICTLKEVCPLVIAESYNLVDIQFLLKNISDAISEGRNLFRMSDYWVCT